MEAEKSVGHWLSEIEAAKKREKDFRKEGERVLEIYAGKKKDSTPFNILYSNTETLLPALYSAVPRPVVQRRFKDEDPLGKHAATAGQRVLEFLLDTNVDGYETFDEAMRSAVLDGLLPGRGVTCVKYDAEIQGAEDDEYKASELVCTETRSWNRVYFGYARKWSKVPWIAYEEYIDKKEAVRLFGDLAKHLTFSDKENEKDQSEEVEGERHTTCIYQIWDKDGGRQVLYVSPQYKEGVLKIDDDPLELTGFFNCPRPIQFLEKSNDLMPVAVYALYENQAEELNRLTIRINNIVSAIKARGVYDSELGEEIGNIMSADENALIPADKSSSLAAEKGLQNAIWFMPVEQLIAVLMQLYQARENCKQVIYEITGIADIMRGSSNASETLGAQEIKQQWGTLRLKRLQKEVQRYARDLLRMSLELAAKKFSADTFARMTGLPFVTGEKKVAAQQIAMAAQQSGQPVDPQTQQILQSPSWDEVLGMLRDDLQRAYRIDIETNSTVEPEAVEDQKNIAELMNALGQYLNGVTPLVVSGSMPFEAAQAMLLAIVRRFRFGPELEDIIKAMQAPKPPDEGDAKAKQQETDQKAQEGQIKLEVEQIKLQTARENAQLERDRMAAERERMAMDQQRMVLEKQKAEQDMRLTAEKAQAEIAIKQRTAQEGFDIERRKLNQQWSVEMARMGKEGGDAETPPVGVLQELMTKMQEKDDESMRDMSLANMMQAMADGQKAQADALMAGLAQIAESMRAPKRLVRDGQGRATGVEVGAA